MDLYEYQGKELFARFGIPTSKGRRRDDSAGGSRGGGGDRRPGRRQGAGAHRRPRQGGRDQARRRPGRRRAQGRGDPRARHQRPRRAQALDRAGLGDRQGVLPLGHLRPRHEAVAVHAHDRGRGRDRGGRREEPRCARAPARRPVRGLPALPGPAPDLRRGDRRPERAEAAARHHRQALPLLRRERRDALRDQPADRHARGRDPGARLEVHRRRQRALQAPGHRRDARPRGLPARGARRPREGRHLREARRRGRDPRQRRRARDVHARRDRARRRPARELLRPRRRRRRAGRGRRARGDHGRPAGEVDPVQHLRRDHALRRGGARDPAGALADRDLAPDRRPLRRDERRGGPRRSWPRPRRRTCTSRRRCSRRPSARWSWRHERPGRSAPRRTARARAHREGADLDLVVEWCEPAEGVKALDVATGGGHVARRLRELGRRGGHARPVAGDAGGRAGAGRAHPVRRRRLRRRRHADRAAPLRGHPRRGRPSSSASATGSS